MNEKEILKFIQKTIPEDIEHLKQVAKLSVIIFEQTKDLHNLNEDEKEKLYLAALLHDVGYSISFSKHHKNSLKIILTDEQLKFTKIERIIIGLIARYHRKALPSNKHKYYCDLEKKEKEIINKLAAIIRIADGLDFTHRNIIENIKIKIKKNDVEFFCKTKYPPEIEFQKAQKKADLFEKIYKKKIVLFSDIK